MELISKIKITKTYGRYGRRILSNLGIVESLEGSRGMMEVKKPLPTQEEYQKLLVVAHTESVEELIEDAYCEFETLASELQDWYDNLPEQFQNGEKGDMLQEAIRILEDAQLPDLPECIQEDETVGRDALTTVFYPSISTEMSRADRCQEAVGMLQTVVDKLDEEAASLREQEGIGADMTDTIHALDDLKEELENTISEVDGIEFPGMYS